MHEDIFDIMESDSGTSSSLDNVQQDGLRSVAELARDAQQKSETKLTGQRLQPVSIEDSNHDAKVGIK